MLMHVRARDSLRPSLLLLMLCTLRAHGCCVSGSQESLSEPSGPQRPVPEASGALTGMRTETGVGIETRWGFPMLQLGQMGQQ